MDQLQAFNKLLQIIKGEIRHPFYEETKLLAKDYRAFSTGDGLDEKLERFSSRESEEAFRERKRITIHLSKSIISNLTHIYYRVPRSNGMKLNWKAESDKQQQDFNDILLGFCRDGAIKYLEQRVKDLIELDPNAWLVIEFKGTDGTQYAQPYPYEVYAENAIMYEYDVAKLIYLVDMRTIKMPDPNGNMLETDQYTIYTDIGAVKITKKPGWGLQGLNLKDVQEVEEIPELWNDGNYTYFVEVPQPYNLKAVPARCVGYLQDKKNRGLTFVNMYDSCVPIFEKMLKANSEMDVSMSKHVHPQKIQYVRRCVNESCNICEDGKYYVDWDEKKLCPSCSGRGWLDVTTGGLEYIYFPLPLTKDEMIDLSNVVHYVPVDVETPQFLKDYLDYMTNFAKKMMFNQDDISAEDVAKTAREIMVNEYNKDDTLRPYAVNYSLLYRFLIKTCSEITTIPISVLADVSKDFNMRGLAEWTTILQGLTVAGANDMIIASVQNEIMRSLHGETDVTKQYALIQALIPFQDLSKEMKALMLASLDKNDKYRVAAIYGYDFIKQLEHEEVGFWDMAFDKQRDLFYKKVDQRIEEMKAETPVLPNFTAQ